jgi:drug/metabolite transporter (DMT)-like permease
MNSESVPRSLTTAQILLLFCVIVWGWTFVATKVCLQYMSPLELVGLRFLIGVPILSAVIRLKRIPFAFSAREYGALMLGALIITTHFLLQAVALNYTSATKTGWIIAVSPLAMAVLSVLLLKEKIGRKETMGIALASAGIVVLVSNGALASLGWLKSVGDWLVLVSAHTWALYTIVTRNVSRSRNPLTVTVVVFAPLVLASLGYLLVSGRASALVSLPAPAIGGLLFLAVPGTLAQWFWQIGTAKIGAARAGIFLYLEPIATAALAVPLLGEQFTLFTAAGGALVIAGVWWAQRR